MDLITRFSALRLNKNIAPFFFSFDSPHLLRHVQPRYLINSPIHQGLLRGSLYQKGKKFCPQRFSKGKRKYDGCLARDSILSHLCLSQFHVKRKNKSCRTWHTNANSHPPPIFTVPQLTKKESQEVLIPVTRGLLGENISCDVLEETLIYLRRFPMGRDG